MRTTPQPARPAAVVAVAVVLAVLASGCGTGSGGGFNGPEAGAPEHDAGGGHPRDARPPPEDVPNFGESSSPEATTGGSAVVYAQTKDTLYTLDPMTNAVTTVGVFDGCAEVIDIALDANSNMFATTLDGLYTVDPMTAKCTLVANGSNYPNSLSFVPAGTLDPMNEALVGYVGDTYVHIDTKSGAITMLGTIGQGYSSSGDIVSVKGGGNPTYLTVKGGPKGTCDDCLIQVDPSTGAYLLDWGPINHEDVFGIAFWGGAVYGFDTAGDLFEIQFHGLAMQITDIPYPDAPAGLSWFGAGSTTSAPLVPVK
jgi:hypothetical protein